MIFFFFCIFPEWASIPLRTRRSRGNKYLCSRSLFRISRKTCFIVSKPIFPFIHFLHQFSKPFCIVHNLQSSYYKVDIIHSLAHQMYMYGKMIFLSIHPSRATKKKNEMCTYLMCEVMLRMIFRKEMFDMFTHWFIRFWRNISYKDLKKGMKYLPLSLKTMDLWRKIWKKPKNKIEM